MVLWAPRKLASDLMAYRTRKQTFSATMFLFAVVTPLFARQDHLVGHLEPLFAHGKRFEVEVYHGFPTAEEFYKRFVYTAKPVLFRGGAMLFPASSLWNDDYFLSFPESEEHLVTVEVEKKENRSTPGEDIPFADFVRGLHSSGKYMVSSVPEFLRYLQHSNYRDIITDYIYHPWRDVFVPPPIACQDITQGNLVQDMLWFSSGGTKSVLHNDYAENIMCVFRGTKEFFLVDKKYQELVNVTERGYSEVDVDRVDLFKYPGLYNIEHYFAFLEPGDCLYVPFLWVHHVRSYDVNIAVNIWWRNGVEVNFSECDARPGRTIKDLTFIGFGALHDAQEKLIRNRLIQAVKLRGDKLILEGLQEFFAQPDVFGADVQWTEDMFAVVKKLFILMDKSHDDKITLAELNNLREEDWKQVRMLVNDLTDLLMTENDQTTEQETHSTKTEQWQENVQTEPEIHTEL